MKTSRFNEGQIIKAIKEHEGGRKAEDIVRDLWDQPGDLLQMEAEVRLHGGERCQAIKRLRA